MIIWVFGLVFVGGFDTAHAAARYITKLTVSDYSDCNGCSFFFQKKKKKFWMK